VQGQDLSKITSWGMNTDEMTNVINQPQQPLPQPVQAPVQVQPAPLPQPVQAPVQVQPAPVQQPQESIVGARNTQRKYHWDEEGKTPMGSVGPVQGPAAPDVNNEDYQNWLEQTQLERGWEQKPARNINMQLRGPPEPEPWDVNWDNENQQAPPQAPQAQAPARLPTLIPQGRGPISQVDAHNNLVQGPVPGSREWEALSDWEKARLGSYWKSFADEVINRLGPDMVYKMTPHQLGTLSAYMYLKLR
jgi:hypothetical protein